MVPDQDCGNPNPNAQWLVADSYLYSSQLTVHPFWKEDPRGVTSLPLDFLSYLTTKSLSFIAVTAVIIIIIETI